MAVSVPAATRAASFWLWVHICLLGAACLGNGLEPTSDRTLLGVWSSESYGPAALGSGNGPSYVPQEVLIAGASGATLRLPCSEYESTTPIVLIRDGAFSVLATGKTAGVVTSGYRLEGLLRADGGLSLYVVPPRPSTAGETVANFALLYELSPSSAEKVGVAACGY